MTPQQKKYLIFRVRMLLLYPIGLLAIIYFCWLAPLFGLSHRRHAQQRIPQCLSRAVLWLNGIRLRVEGIEHLRSAAGRRVLLTNHNSRFDGYILLAICPFAFKSFWSDTAHVTTEGFGFVARIGRVFDLFFVHDKSSKRATLAEFIRAERYLQDGGNLSFFPEGQFSSDGWVRDIGTACVRLAVNTDAEIVPIVILDSHVTFETRGEFGHTTPEISLKILPPIATIGRHKSEVPALANELETLMNRTLAAAREMPCPSTAELAENSRTKPPDSLWPRSRPGALHPPPSNSKGALP